MAANNNIIYPAGSRVFFDGGLNNKFDVNLIPDNESPDCLNVVFEDGAVATRLGIATMNSWVTDVVGSNVCDGLFVHTDETNTEEIVSVYGGQVYIGETASSITSILRPSSFVTGTRCTAAEYQQNLFIGQSGATPYRLTEDGDMFLHGIPAASSTSHSMVASGAGTSLSGSYSYKYSWVNTALIEGDVSSNTSYVTVASSGVQLIGLPTAPASYGVAFLNIYRNAAADTDVWLRATQLTAGAYTNWDDNNTDADLGIAAPIDQGVPPNYSVSIYHQGRLFCIDPEDNLVKYSELGNPYVFKATSFIRAGDASGDIPVGLDIYDNSVVVLCKRSPWLIYMASTDDTDWRLLRIRSPYGTKSKFGSFRYNNKVMYPAVQAGRFVGFAALEGQTVSPSASLLTNTALGSDLQSTRVEDSMNLVNEDLVPDIYSHVYERKAYISLPIDTINTDGSITQATENNRIFVFDFSLGRLDRKQEASWAVWDNCKFSCFTEYRHSSLDKTQIFGGSILADGYIRELNVEDTYNDDGATAINSYYYTKKFAGNKRDENFHKDFRYALILHEVSTTDQDMNFSYIVDGQSTGTTNVVALTGGADWGQSNWYEFQWSPGVGTREQRQYIAPSYGKRIQFKFDNQNTSNQWFKIYGFNFVYNNKGLR